MVAPKTLAVVTRVAKSHPCWGDQGHPPEWKMVHGGLKKSCCGRKGVTGAFALKVLRGVHHAHLPQSVDALDKLRLMLSRKRRQERDPKYRQLLAMDAQSEVTREIGMTPRTLVVLEGRFDVPATRFVTEGAYPYKVRTLDAIVESQQNLDEIFGTASKLWSAGVGAARGLKHGGYSGALAGAGEGWRQKAAAQERSRALGQAAVQKAFAPTRAAQQARLSGMQQTTRDIEQKVASRTGRAARMQGAAEVKKTRIPRGALGSAARAIGRAFGGMFRGGAPSAGTEAGSGTGNAGAGATDVSKGRTAPAPGTGAGPGGASVPSFPARSAPAPAPAPAPTAEHPAAGIVKRAGPEHQKKVAKIRTGAVPGAAGESPGRSGIIGRAPTSRPAGAGSTPRVPAGAEERLRGAPRRTERRKSPYTTTMSASCDVPLSQLVSEWSQQQVALGLN